MKKIKKSIISMFMAFVLMFSFLLPIGQVNTASAQAAGQQNTYSLNDDYDTVYYFSDNQNAANYASNFASVGIAFNYEIFAPDFFEGVNEYNNGQEFDEISNAYVIFELTQELEEEIVPTNSTATIQILETIFFHLKERGCEIMFICSTDEMLFSDYAGFLNYVDVHINTDMICVFMTSVIHYMIEDCGSDEIANCTILLDTTFDITINAQAIYSFAFNYYFKEYFRSIYKTEIQSNDWTLNELLDAKNINILRYMGGTTFFDEANNTIVNADEIEDNDYIYAIGSSAAGQAAMNSWLQVIDGIRTARYNFDVYVYNPAGYTITLTESINLFTAGSAYDTMYIQLDFVTGQDMTSYHNWWGICDITHKTITCGDGWMISWIGEGYDISSAWKLIIDEDEYNANVNYSPVW